MAAIPMPSHTRASIALALLVLVMAPAALGGEYYGIIHNFDKKPRSARMDVAVDIAPGQTDVQFDVYSENGVSIAHFIERTNPWGFASTTSTVNLVDLTAGQPLLVRAFTPSATPSAATLYVDSTATPLTIGLTSAVHLDGTALAQGREFSIALGSHRKASILVANVGGSNQVVDVHVGTRGPDGGGIYSNPRLGPVGIWRVDLTDAEALSNLVVTSTGPIVVQVAIDDGKGFRSFQVIPSTSL